MFVKHSVKNILRSWKKSLLFFFLIVMLVVIISIGVSLSVTINDILTDCEESYITIAKMEYMGAEYPDETSYDPNIATCYDSFDFSKITSDSAVIGWDSTDIALGYVEGRTDVNTLAPFKKKAVLIVRADAYYKEYEKVTSGIVAETLYSYENVQDMMMYISTSGFELVPNHYYVLNGEFYLGQSGYKYFKITAFENDCASVYGFDGSIENMILDVTNEEGGYTLPEDSYFHTVAETYATVNKCVTVQATNDLEALFPFQQSSLYLTDGRAFNEEEYSAGSNVCVMSQALAEYLNLQLGDEFTLSMAAQSGCSKNESYWAAAGFSYSAKYTVVGITNTDNELKNTIYIPKTDAFDFSVNRFSFTLGQVKLINGQADQFLSDLEPDLADRVRLTVYDQGYSDVTQPLSDILRIAMIVTAVTVIVGVAIAGVFGFLFVFRQSDVAKIMRRLGAKKKNIYTYFLFGSGTIALSAAVVGAAVSACLSGLCMKIVEWIVMSYSSGDMLYSNGSLSMVKAIEFAPNIDFWIFLSVGFGVFALSLLSCLIFGAVCVNSHSRHRRVSVFGGGSVRSRTLNGGALKYSWLSVKRGLLRSFIPVVLSVCAVALLFQLTYTTRLYQNKLNEINSGAEISGYFTDVHGMNINKLSLRGSDVRNLQNSGMLSEISVSKSEYYLYIGVSAEDGVSTDLPPYDLPAPGSFAMETFINKIENEPHIIFTNNFYTVPEFYFSSMVEAEFLDGYDASVFAGEIGEIPYCMVSTDFMEENGVNLGDTIRMIIYDTALKTEDMFVIGSYVKAGTENNIYCQLGYYVSPSLLFGKDTSSSRVNRYVFNSASFKLKSGAVLSGFKSYLNEKGYSEVNVIHDIRSFVTIEDKSFLNTTSALKQRIWYMNNTFPIIYILVEAIGGLVPYILIQMRKREIAIMRGQGATAKTAFYSVFFEQLMLCSAGAVIGIVAWASVIKTFNWLGLLLSLLFVGCWLGGTALSVRHINKGSVRSILKAEE